MKADGNEPQVIGYKPFIELLFQFVLTINLTLRVTTTSHQTVVLHLYFYDEGIYLVSVSDSTCEARVSRMPIFIGRSHLIIN